MSAVGSTETYEARVARSRDFVAFAAFDAGLIEFDAPVVGAIEEGPLKMRWASGDRAGHAASIEDIEELYGSSLRANLGVRVVPERIVRSSHSDLSLDIAALLPHDLNEGGLRRLAGLGFKEIRESPLKDMYGLFDDDPWLSPSLQAQLFVYAGIGALAALPKPLREIVPEPYAFRVCTASAFQGLDALASWIEPSSPKKVKDRFAIRLANSLSSHGAALVSTMLAPAYSISRSLKNPSLLDSLESQISGFNRVPQAPLNVVGACASSLIAFCEFAPQLLFDYPGYQKPSMVLWTAADAGLQPHLGLLEGFGGGAMMTTAKLEAANAGRAPDQKRSVSDSLAPFDVDANGTVIGHAGTGVLVTTLEFAMKNFLDITSIVVGWGQSGEAGGKAHFAGVGFGGENGIIHALDMARDGHGYGLDDFQYLVAHATGTRTNSKTDLTTAANARAVLAKREGLKTPLQMMTVGTPKSVGDGHSMGETGLKAVSQAIQYVLGKTAVAVPTLRQADPELGAAAELFRLQSDPVRGGESCGALCATQGFGGYNGAIALRSANPESIARYGVDPKVLSAYLERWPQLRRERDAHERYWRRRRGGALELASSHRWLGAEDS